MHGTVLQHLYSVVEGERHDFSIILQLAFRLHHIIPKLMMMFPLAKAHAVVLWLAVGLSHGYDDFHYPSEEPSELASITVPTVSIPFSLSLIFSFSFVSFPPLANATLSPLFHARAAVGRLSVQ